MEVDGNQVCNGVDQEEVKRRYCLGKVWEKICSSPCLVFRKVWKVGREDPRRVIHAFKVGLSLTLVSLLYLLEPLFEGVGRNAIWAVMTVVVVLEFTAGATLCKGLNRGVGTLAAGTLAFFIEYVADKSSKVLQAVFIGTTVFVIGTACTYLRFFPYIKKNYDYGVVIFLLTFNLITVSSFRVHNVLQIAHERFYTIAIGCGICLLMSLLFFPNWSGEELHNSTVSKLEGLARSIEACVNQYYQDAVIVEEESADEDPIFNGYRAILDSKAMEETLALHASWEPRRTRQCYKYPWHQYVKLGSVLRHFGYTAVALHGCLQSEIQTPRSVRALFKAPCTRVAGEISKIFMELASSIRNRRHCSPELLLDNLHEALQDLNNSIKSQPRLFLSSNRNHHVTNMLALAAATANQKQEKDSGVTLSSVKTDSSTLFDWKFNHHKIHKESEQKVLRPTLSKIANVSLEFSEALPFAAFASLLVEMAARLEMVIEEVEELARMANFKEFQPDELEIIIAREKTRKVDRRDVRTNLSSHHDTD